MPPRRGFKSTLFFEKLLMPHKIFIQQSFFPYSVYFCEIRDELI